MTLVVLGIDALDSRLVSHFAVNHPSISTDGEMETIAEGMERPHTTQVWPTMATGMMPSEHGVGYDTTSEWQNPVVEWASNLGSFLPLALRKRIGNVISKTTGDEWTFASVDVPTFADEPGVFLHNWPGVVHNDSLKRAWDEIDYANRNGSSPQEFDLLNKSLGASKFGWVRQALQHDASVVGTQIHSIDTAGHAYSTQEKAYRNYYEWLFEQIELVFDSMAADDEMLIVSDHGMSVSWLDDEEPGQHSWFAYSASTLPTRPEHVLDVKRWILENMSSYDSEGQIDLPQEQLEDLGYI